MSSATARAQAFAQAIADQDEAAAQAVCGAWTKDSDTPCSLYHQALRKGMYLGAGVLLVEQDGRSAVAVPLLRMKDGEETLLAGLHLLDNGQALVGVARLPALAHLYVEGALPPCPDFEGLPESAEALAFVKLLVDALHARALDPLADAASDTLESLCVLRQLAHQVEEEGHTIALVRSYGLPQAERYAVQIQTGDTPWFWMLQRAPGGGLQSRMLATYGSFERLLDPSALTPRPV